MILDDDGGIEITIEDEVVEEDDEDDADDEDFNHKMTGVRNHLFLAGGKVRIVKTHFFCIQFSISL